MEVQGPRPVAVRGAAAGRHGLGSQSGTYCWRHLFVQIWGHPPEEERYKRAVTELRGPQPWHYTGGGPITR